MGMSGPGAILWQKWRTLAKVVFNVAEVATSATLKNTFAAVLGGRDRHDANAGVPDGAWGDTNLRAAAKRGPRLLEAVEALRASPGPEDGAYREAEKSSRQKY